jgi:hypothetical protein
MELPQQPFRVHTVESHKCVEVQKRGAEKQHFLQHPHEEALTLSLPWAAICDILAQSIKDNAAFQENFQ